MKKQQQQHLDIKCLLKNRFKVLLIREHWVYFKPKETKHNLGKFNMLISHDSHHQLRWPHTKRSVWITINTTADLKHVNQTIIWIRKEFTFLGIHSNLVSTATALFHVCLQLWLEIFVLKWAAWQIHNTAHCVLLHDES